MSCDLQDCDLLWFTVNWQWLQSWVEQKQVPELGNAHNLFWLESCTSHEIDLEQRLQFFKAVFQMLKIVFTLWTSLYFGRIFNVSEMVRASKLFWSSESAILSQNVRFRAIRDTPGRSAEEPKFLRNNGEKVKISSKENWGNKMKKSKNKQANESLEMMHTRKARPEHGRARDLL